MSEPKEIKPAEPQRRPAGAKEYDRISAFLADLKAQGETFPLTPERGRQLLGDEGYIAAVKYERSEAGKEPLDDAYALIEPLKAAS